jgi:predicted secreted Zn-dependent protease
MRLATDYLRDEAYERLTKIAKEHGGELEKAINELITVKDKADSKVKAQVVANLLNKVSKNEDIQKALQSIDQLPKKSQ